MILCLYNLFKNFNYLNCREHQLPAFFKLLIIMKAFLFPLAVIFYIFIVSSCANESGGDQRSLKIIQDSVEFNVSYYAHPYYHDFGTEEAFGFAEFTTAKKISVFNESRRLLYTVKVDSAMKTTNSKFCTMDFVSMDSILLLSPYRNKVSVINAEGQMVYHKDYSYLFDAGYEIWPTVHIERNQLLASISYLTPPHEDNLDSYTVLKNQKLAKKILIDTSFFTHAKPVLAVDSFYNRFAKSDEMTMEGDYYEPGKDGAIICYSGYSDTLYIYGRDGVLSRMIPVKSRLKNIKMKPITLEMDEKDGSLLNKNFIQSAFISELLYDKYRDLYYCIIRHKKQGDILPYNILIFDGDFNPLDEITIDTQKYANRYFVTKQGLWLNYSSGTNMRKQYFSIFRYE